jgi:hypothetical protein
MLNKPTPGLVISDVNKNDVTHGADCHNTKIRTNLTSYSNHMLTIRLKFLLTIIISEGYFTYKEFYFKCYDRSYGKIPLSAK